MNQKSDFDKQWDRSKRIKAKSHLARCGGFVNRSGAVIPCPECGRAKKLLEGEK